LTSCSLNLDGTVSFTFFTFRRNPLHPQTYIYGELIWAMSITLFDDDEKNTPSLGTITKPRTHRLKTENLFKIVVTQIKNGKSFQDLCHTH
jgi:hypothetical protein